MILLGVGVGAVKMSEEGHYDRRRLRTVSMIGMAIPSAGAYLSISDKF